MFTVHSNVQFSRIRYLVNMNFQNEEELKSVGCNITYEDKTQLKQQNLLKHSTGSKPQCLICQKSFSNKSNLSTHVKNMHKEKEEANCNYTSYPCKICDKTYSQMLSLQRHIESIHEGRRWTCKTCGKSFNKSGNLRTHEKTHLGKKYTCEECQKEYLSENNYKHHMKYVHGSQRHKCLQCEKCYKTKNHLNRHIDNSHRILKVKCDLCNREFNSDNLNRHMKHSHGHNTLKHKCNICEQEYKSTRSLNQHRRLHEGSLVKCDICNVTMSANSMYRHKLQTQEFFEKSLKTSS